jgi:hypothetical protein
MCKDINWHYVHLIHNFFGNPFIIFILKISEKLLERARLLKKEYLCKVMKVLYAD